MSINVNLLREICRLPGIPGHEKRIRDFVKKEVEKLVDDVYTDNMGNLITLKKGKKSDKKVMIAAHMDEIGFVVKHIDNNGFLKFMPVGGFDPKTLTAQRVIVHGKKDLIGVMGSKPIHVMSPEERKKIPELNDYFIDLGLSKNEVDKFIEVGDSVTRLSELIEMGDCVNTKSLDNRISVFILIEMLRELKKPEYDVYGVFTVQEEVGLRGATVAAHAINPDFSFGLDTTIAFDVPGAKPEENVTRLGEGTAIKLLDTSAICDYRMVKFMKQTANKHKIKWQPEILTGGGTDTAAMQRMAKYGTIAGAVSIPTRHIHQHIEMVNKKDVRASIDLLKHCVQDIHTFDFSS